jgi:hypothetical protein
MTESEFYTAAKMLATQATYLQRDLIDFISRIVGYRCTLTCRILPLPSQTVEIDVCSLLHEQEDWLLIQPSGALGVRSECYPDPDADRVHRQMIVCELLNSAHGLQLIKN